MTSPEGSTTRENAFLYENSKPVIDFTRPLSGPTSGNKVIDIYGFNFTPSTNVTLGDKTYELYRFYNSGRIRIRTQASDAGVDITALNENGSDTLKKSYEFSSDSSVNAGEPIVSWIKNARSPLTGHTKVIVRGKALGQNCQ